MSRAAQFPAGCRARVDASGACVSPPHHDHPITRNSLWKGAGWWRSWKPALASPRCSSNRRNRQVLAVAAVMLCAIVLAIGLVASGHLRRRSILRRCRVDGATPCAGSRPAVERGFALAVVSRVDFRLIVRVDTGNVRKQFTAICKAAGIGSDWGASGIAERFASLLSWSGAPVEEIARPAGHSSTRAMEVIYRKRAPASDSDGRRDHGCRPAVFRAGHGRYAGPFRAFPAPRRRGPCPAAGPGIWDGAAARPPSIR